MSDVVESHPAPAAAPAAPAQPAAPITRPNSIHSQARPARDRFFSTIDDAAKKEADNQPPVKIAARLAKEGEAHPDDAPETAFEKPETAKPGEKPPEKAPEKPADEFPDEAAATKMRAGELSRHYKGLKKAHNELKAKLATIEAERAKGNADDPERVKLTETLKEREKRIGELDEIVRFKAYEESTEYREKYDNPFVAAFQSARAVVQDLRIVERKDPETGEIIQPMRRATAEDFDNLFKTQDRYDAGIIAEQMFGPNAPAVLYHREKVVELCSAKLNALETHRREGGEILKKQQEAMVTASKEMQATVSKLWEKHSAAPLSNEKMAHLFKPIEGDTEGNALLDKGYEEAKETFKTILPPTDPRLTHAQREKIIEMHAELFNKAAAFNRVHFLYAKTQKALKAAEEKLKAFEDTAPTAGNGQRVTNGRPPGQLSARDRFYAAMDKVAIPIPR